MTDATTPSITGDIFPALRFENADSALGWLEHGLGFVPHAVHRDGEGRILHAEMRFGNSGIMFGQARPDESGNPWAVTPFGIYVVVEDVDVHHARAARAGLEIVHPPRDTGYGSREYALRDPEGRLWSFGTYRP